MRKALASQDDNSLILEESTNQIILVNKKACQSLGYNITDLINCSSDTIIPKNFQLIRFSQQQGKVVKEICRFITKCGYSFMGLAKRRKLVIKNKSYQHITFQSICDLVQISEVNKNADKNDIEFLKRLSAINMKVTNFHDDMFLKNMVYSFADAFKVRWVMICLLVGKTEAKVLTLWDKTKFTNELVYKLIGTPCSKVKETKLPVYCEKNLTNHFPEDFLAYQWGVESYLGIPITSKEDEVLGLLAVMDDKPIQKKKSIEYLATMQYFSERIADEITSKVFNIKMPSNVTLSKEIELIPKQNSLTNRELQILKHVLSGITNNLIGKQIGVSLSTVNFHLKNIYKKLDVKGKNGLLKMISRLEDL